MAEQQEVKAETDSERLKRKTEQKARLEAKAKK